LSSIFIPAIRRALWVELDSARLKRGGQPRIEWRYCDLPFMQADLVVGSRIYKTKANVAEGG